MKVLQNFSCWVFSLLQVSVSQFSSTRHWLISFTQLLTLPDFIYHQFPITHVPQVSIFPNRYSWKLAPTLYHYAGHTQGLSPVLLYVWWCTTVIGILRITFKFQQVLTYLITFSWLKQTYLFSQTWDSDNGRVARKICSNSNGFKLFHENCANFSRLVVTSLLL